MDLLNTKRVFCEHTRSIQIAIKLLILVVFQGYIMIWTMMPTNVFWLHWLPYIHDKTDSTFFGRQGENILIYTLPILLIATLGCIYLHLNKYTCDHKTPKDSHFVLWKRPILVRGPLGIVSWTELAFLLMFVTLLVWSFLAYVHGMFKNITRQSASKMGDFVWEVKLDSAALLLGLVGNICFTFLFFPVTRGSSIFRLIGLTSESTIKYHIWLGHIVLTLFTAHGLCYAIFWAKTHQMTEMLKWDEVGISNVAGEVAFLCGLAMWLTSFRLVRRKLFELFFYTHHVYIVFVVFFVFHVGFSYSCIMLPGFYLFLIDRYLRFLQSQQKVRLISARVLPCQAIELNFSKDPKLDYCTSSIMFINVKSISKLQWHPFTVISNSNLDPDRLSIVVKKEGNWTQKLYEKFSSPHPIDHLEVSVEGPYGHPSTSFLRHDKLVMVSGGSGITPFISIIKELVFIANASNKKIPRILLVASFKKSEDLTMLELLIPISRTSFDISFLNLQIQAFITREKTPTTDSWKLPRTIWLKPSILDKPVYAVLGSNNWLWLGAIISSSFIVFLLLIGLITQFYIYPVDRNTDAIYSHTIRSIISLSFLCVSIMITATIAFTLNKKRNTNETRQIQSVESWPNEVDRELESLKQQSFAEFTTLHYGRRPDLKKIIFDCEESNVGVLVSGPEKMRQDVATICSSDSAKNLQCESFSFNW